MAQYTCHTNEIMTTVRCAVLCYTLLIAAGFPKCTVWNNLSHFNKHLNHYRKQLFMFETHCILESTTVPILLAESIQNIITVTLYTIESLITTAVTGWYCCSLNEHKYCMQNILVELLWNFF